jgi:predicted permease
MGTLRRFFARLTAFFFPDRAEREMNREMAAFQALAAENGNAARFAARQVNVQAREAHRDARSFVWLEQLWQDLRHSARGLLKNPRFSAVAMISLALGIGANTAIFTLVNGILLKRLPVPDPDRIVQVKAHLDTFESSGFSYPAAREVMRQKEIFSDTAAFSSRRAVLDLEGQPQKVDLLLVGGSYFSFFGARPFAGRLIDDEDDRVERAHPVCVMSYQLWRNQFNSDAAIIGRSLRVNGLNLQVVGVASPDFVGAELQRRFDLFSPTAMVADFDHNERENANSVWVRLLGRLRPGLSFGEARARLAVVSKAIEAPLPKGRANADAVYTIRDASHGFDSWRTELSDPLNILMGAVALVLLVACANLANLLLARASERQREFAVKVSLGISRLRLMRQTLVESTMIALCGGAAGIGVSVVLTRVLLDTFNAGNEWRRLTVTLDRSVLLFTFGASLLTALVAGLYPAWHASRTDAALGLKGSSMHGLGRGMVRRALILVQVTLAVVLLFGASLFTHSLRNLKTISLGYDIQHVLTADINDNGPRSALKPVTAPPALAEVLARVERLPGVVSAAWSMPGVLSTGSMNTTVKVVDRHGDERSQGNVFVMFASPQYLQTLGIPLRRGRNFEAGDRPGAPMVALVNELLASELWPGQDPIGMTFKGWNTQPVQIVGVVGNSVYANVREKPRPIFYQPFNQMPVTGGALEIRARGSFAQVERDVREIVKSVTTGYRVSNVASMEVMRDNLIAQDRLLSFLSSQFGVLGTLLALVGIYGLISYSVSCRNREIGIRMSLGAQVRTVLWLFLREGAVLIAAGIVLGAPLALIMARFLEKLLYQVRTDDAPSIWATIALLAGTGIAASFIPARRATRVNPVEALRCE